MVRTKMLKKIGAVVLSATLMLSMGVLVFVTGDNGIVASANGSTGTTGSTGTGSSGSTGTGSSGSSVSTSTESTGSAKSGKDTYKSLNQRISGQIDQDIFQAISEGHGVVRIDGTKYGINSLSSDTIKLLNSYDLDAEFSYDYDGSHYVVTIPAGETPISDDVPWYGPKYLVSLYGDTAVVTTIE